MVKALLRHVNEGSGGRTLKYPNFGEKAHPPHADDLARETYGVFGMPIDAVDRTSALKRVTDAAIADRPFLLSTPNVNFMTTAQNDSEFRESLMQSDLCLIDGMPIVWISRLLGIPIKERVSGSDLFDTIRSHGSASQPMKVFLFGGGDGVAETVCGILNSKSTGLRCVGWLNPGFGTVEDMSSESVVSQINASKADLLAVFLSANKAQAWLLHNHTRLSVPVRGQFGATINYQAGIVRRAPRAFQKLGFEWLWRIKEEPYLWRRYWTDGLSLIRLMIFRALPIAIGLRWSRSIVGAKSNELLLRTREQDGSVIISLVGHATEEYAARSIACFRDVLCENRSVVLDVSRTTSIDPRYFGLLLMLRKELKRLGLNLSFTGVSKRISRVFHLNGFEFLLDPASDQ